MTTLCIYIYIIKPHYFQNLKKNELLSFIIAFALNITFLCYKYFWNQDWNKSLVNCQDNKGRK